MATIDQSSQAVLDQIHTKASTSNPSELLQMTVALQNISLGNQTIIDNVQQVTDEGTNQVSNVQTEGTTQVGNVQTEGTTQVGNVNNAIAQYFIDNPISNGTSFFLDPSTLIDQETKGTWEKGWDENNAYARVHQYTKGQFAISSNTFNDYAGTALLQCRMRIQPFQVDQATGQITLGTAGNGYLNTGGYVHSTQAFGFNGNIGCAWGNSAWGSNNTNYFGGCSWRVNDNNTVTQGSHTGNMSYTHNNHLNNGQIHLYDNGTSTTYRIPTTNTSSKQLVTYGHITTSNASATTFPNTSSGITLSTYTSTCYTWRSISRTLGKGTRACVMVYATSNGNYYAVALHPTTYNGKLGSALRLGQLSNQGLGLELDDNQILWLNEHSEDFYQATDMSGLTVATVTKTGNWSFIQGMETCLSSMYNGGDPAVEPNTYYLLLDINVYGKVRINNPSTGVFELELLGTVNLSSITHANLGSYCNYVSVTGTDDDFLVISYRPTSYRPNYTGVFPNPLKDL